jgi:hypothetical protein
MSSLNFDNRTSKRFTPEAMGMKQGKRAAERELRQREPQGREPQDRKQQEREQQGILV